MISDLCGTVAGMVTLKGSMSTEGNHSKILSYFLPIDMFHSAVSVLVVAQQPCSEVPEGLTYYPVLFGFTEIWRSISSK